MLLPFRLPLWVALTLFSLIALLSVLDSKGNSWEFEEKWCVTLISISLGLAGICSIGYCIRDARNKFVATQFEGGLIILLVIVWVMAIPVIMSPGHKLAMNVTQIVDANLYFSAWCAFICTLWMFSSFASDYAVPRQWLCLFISSLIAMTAAIRLLNEKAKYNTCDSGIGKEKCGELRLAIVLSIASAVIAALVAATACADKHLPNIALLVLSLVVLTLWCVLVAKLTFKNGPGSEVGNLFFATWISFFLALFLALMHVFGAMAPDYSDDAPPPPRRSSTRSSEREPKEESAIVRSSRKESA